MCEIWLKLPERPEQKTPEGPYWRCWRRSSVSIVKFEHISHIYVVSTVDFEQVNTV